MRGNASTSNLEQSGTCKVVSLVPGRKAGAAERAARLAEIGRNFSLQVIVRNPDGHEILNLTKMTLKRDLHDLGNTTPDIRDVIALLIDAAQEHVLAFE
jgi:D-serine deaminase-like pyridoxal phosphate-dependent protein